MNEFIERNGFELAVDDDDDETFQILMDVTTGKVSEEEFADWVSARIRRP
jgi:prophage maintenance system killer protein